MSRPFCINLGCNSYAAPIRGRIGEEGVRYRVFCGTCHKNSYEAVSYTHLTLPTNREV